MTIKEFDEYIKSYQRNLSGENLREFNENLDKLKNFFTYEEIIDRFKRLEREEVEVEIEEENKNEKKYDIADENKHILTNKKGWLIFFSVFLLSIFLFYQFSQVIFNTNKKQAPLKHQSKTKIKETKKEEKNTRRSNVVDENNKEIQKKQNKNLDGIKIKRQHEEFFKNLNE